MSVSKHSDYQGNLVETFLAASSVSGADPAAGAEWLITVPAGERWLVKSVSVALVQGATQTPWPVLVIDDGTNVLFEAHAGTAAAAASTTTQVSWVPGAPMQSNGVTTACVAVGPLPADLVLEAGARIRTLTTGIGANTNYGVPWASVIKLPV